MNKFYITTPIYYVNDKPHLGHAYTTIAADCLARYYRKKIGKDHVQFLTGTDEHGKKNAEAAEKLGLEPQAFVDRQAEIFQKAWANLNISHDIFARTTNPDHYAAVSQFMQKLYDQGDIYEGVYEGLYCVGCEKFLTEKDLVDGLCPDHKRKPELLKEKNYFFRLRHYLPKVQKLIERGDVVIEPDARKKEVMGLFKQQLDDFSVSRENIPWGIPVPWDESQTLYVWVEALQNYLSFAGYGLREDDFKKWWPADLHLMAKDIVKFHAIYWPALLLAAGLEPPKKIFAHGFFTINGQKMSKSLGNAIDPEEMVQEFGIDATRYLLLSQFPFGQDGDIQAGRFVEKYNADLADGLGNLVSRVTSMVQSYLNGQIREKKIKREYDVKKMNKDMEALRFTEVLDAVFRIIAETNKKINDTEPWRKAKEGKEEDVSDILSEAVLRLRDVAEVLAPFMPQTSEIIMTSLSDFNNIQKPPALFLRKP